MATDPAINCWFGIDFQGKVAGAFRECSGLGSESQVVEYKGSSDSDKNFFRKIPGRMKWNDITLKRGMTDSLDMWEWRKMVEDGKVEDARRDGSIVMYDGQGSEIGRWNFLRAWPTKISGPSTNAGGNEPAIEELAITHEGYIRVK